MGLMRRLLSRFGNRLLRIVNSYEYVVLHRKVITGQRLDGGSVLNITCPKN
jgi:hypothetical protein